MDECRILFLNAARRKKLEIELRCVLRPDPGLTRPPRNSAEVIDLDEVRASGKTRRKD